MALNKVTLTWDLTDMIVSGQSATLTLEPTAQLSDAADGLVVGEISRSVIFAGGTGRLAGIIANDNSQIRPAGWAYQVTITLESGGVVVGPEDIFINFANGATQDLSALLASPAVPQLAQYLPLPSGTPASGDVPAWTGPGAATQWAPGGGGGAVSSVFGRTGTVTAQSGDYTAAQVGADAAGAAAAAQAAAEAASDPAGSAATAQAASLPRAGGTMSGPLAMSGNKITGIAAGTAATDAAQYGQTPAGGAIVSGQFLRAPNVYAPGTRNPLAVTSTSLAPFFSGTVCTGSFTAPPSGSVLVKATFVASISVAASMAFGLCATGTTTPAVGNITQFRDSSGSAQARAYICEFLVTGLVSANSYNFDLMGAAASGDTVTIYAEAQTTTTPGLAAATDGGPVTMTVQAV